MRLKRGGKARCIFAGGASIMGGSFLGGHMHNKSANTDPHLHKAASPLKVVVRLPSR